MRDPSSLDTILYAKVLGSGGGGSSDAVLYTPQTLTGEQKAQARANIGATDASTSIPDDVKVALLNCFEHVAWTDDQGQTYYDALEAALYPLDHITAVYVQSGTVYDTDSLDSLKADLTVTAYYEGGNTATIAAANYTLSGTLTVGTSTITVSYGGKTATFNVTVTESPLLYALDSETAFNGTSDAIDTGVYPYDSSEYESVTILLEFMPLNVENSTTKQVLCAFDSNNKGLAINIASSKMYGGGLNYDNRVTVANNKKYRSAQSITFATRYLRTQFYNVTDGNSIADGNITSSVDYLNDRTVMLGFDRANQKYWQGTIYRAYIRKGLLASEQITAWLENGTTPR